MADWRDDEARKRGLFREVNEQVRSVHEVFEQDGSDGTDGAFVCECGNGTCAKSLTVPPAEYEAVRAHARRFLVASDHENPEVERVVYQNGQFAVVETFVGDLSRIAEETDPRSRSAAN